MLEDITWFRQAAFCWRDGGRTVYVDPWGTPEGSPLADVILITHAHDDHFRPEEIDRLRHERTAVVAPRDVADDLRGDVVPVVPDERYDVAGVEVSTVPAYNTREEALDFHPRAKRWVGYVVELGSSTYYHAGDTDHAPELDEVRADVTFLPVGGHFTMDAPAAGALARAIGPAVAVPMHYGFVVGSAGDGHRFQQEAAPVPVQILTPVDPFERP